MKSTDGARTWKTMSGTAVGTPTTTDVGGPATMINYASEVDDNTWLASMHEKGGKLHFAYKNRDNGAMRYLRFNEATGAREITTDSWSGGSWAINSVAAAFASDPDDPTAPLFAVGGNGEGGSGNGNRLVALVSYDNGDTWSDHARSGWHGRVSDPGTARAVTADGKVIGSVTLDNPWATTNFFQFDTGYVYFDASGSGGLQGGTGTAEGANFSESAGATLARVNRNQDGIVDSVLFKVNSNKTYTYQSGSSQSYDHWLVGNGNQVTHAVTAAGTTQTINGEIIVQGASTMQWNTANLNIGGAPSVIVKEGSTNRFTVTDGADRTYSLGRLELGTGNNRLETVDGAGNLNVVFTGVSGDSGDVISLGAGGSGKSTLTVDNGGAETFDGVIIGTGRVTKTGSGMLKLTNANTYSGPTNVNGGMLELVGTSTLKNVTSPTGTINVTGGTLQADSDNLWSLGGASTTTSPAVTLNPGGVMTNQAGGSGYAFTLIAPTLSGGTLLANKGYDGTWGSFGLKGTVLVNGTQTSAINQGAGQSNVMINISDNNSGMTGNITFSVTSAASPGLVVNVPLVNMGGKTNGLVKSGSGIMVLSAANTYSGVTTISAGQLTVRHSNALGTTAGNTVLEDGAVLRLENNINLAEAITVHGANNGYGNIRSGGNDTLSGPITLSGQRITNSGGSLTITGGINGTSGMFAGSVTVQTNPITLTQQLNLVLGATTLNVGGNSFPKMAANDNATLKLGPNGSLPDTVEVDLASVNGGTFDLNGKSQTIGRLVGSTRAIITNSSATPATLTMGNGGGDSTFAGVIQDDTGKLALTKTGSGTQILSGANTYTGATTVNAGALLVNGSLAAGSEVTVKGGALGGSGVIGGPVAVSAGATLSLGKSIGTLTLTGSLNLADGALLSFELGPVGASDLVSMTGSTLMLNNQEWSDFSFTTSAGFGPGTYPLIDAGSVSGSLGSIVYGDIGGLTGTLSVRNNDLVLTVVPEPGTMALLAAWLAGLLVAAWRKRK